MSNLQIKGVPDRLHGLLRERAAAAGMSMRDYALRALERELRLDSLDEWLDEAERLEPAAEPASAEEVVELIRSGREERDERILDAASGRARDEG